MKILAHRGASREFPENTLPAFRRAIEIGVDEIETDLVATRDGVIVLHHDEEVLRDATLVPLRDITFHDLKQSHPSIPLLEEVLRDLGRQVTFCLELKSEGLVDRVVEMLRKFELQSRVHFTSFKTEEVMRAKRLCPQARFSWTFSVLPNEIEETLVVNGIDAVSLSSLGFNESVARRLKSKKIKSRIYTVNTLEEARQLQQWGVDAIFTDDPWGMKSLRG